MMKQKGIRFLAAAAALMIGSLAAADTTTPMSVTGKITSIDTTTGRFTVEETNGTSVTYDTTGNTSYMQEGRTIRIGDMKVGDQITVKATGNPDQRVAMSVAYARPSSMAPMPNNNNYNGAPGTMANNNPDRLNDPDRLPRTGSSLPLLGLAGLVLLGAGTAMKLASRGAR